MPSAYQLNALPLGPESDSHRKIDTCLFALASVSNAAEQSCGKRDLVSGAIADSLDRLIFAHSQTPPANKA